MRPQSSVGFGDFFLLAQEFGQGYGLYSWWSQRYAGTNHFQETRRVRIRCRFRCIDAHDEQRRIKMGAIKRSITPTVVLSANGEPAVQSQGKLCEDHGHSYEWVSGQWPRLIEISYLLSFQDHPPILEAVRSPHRNHRTRSSSLSSGSVLERSDEQAIRRLEQETLNIQNHNKRRNDEKERSAGRSSLLVDGVQRKSGGRVACTRTQFLGIRLGTSCRSGNKIKEAQYPTSQETQNNKGSLQTTHWRSSTTRRKLWWLDNGGSEPPERWMCESRDNDRYAVVV